MKNCDEDLVLEIFNLVTVDDYNEVLGSLIQYPKLAIEAVNRTKKISDDTIQNLLQDDNLTHEDLSLVLSHIIKSKKGRITKSMFSEAVSDMVNSDYPFSFSVLVDLGVKLTKNSLSMARVSYGYGTLTGPEFKMIVDLWKKQNPDDKAKYY